MIATRTLAAALTAGALLLTGCSSSDEQLPEINTDSAQEAPEGPNVVGLMHDVTRDKVTIKMPDGSLRDFAVRPQDEAALGLGHLRSHMGLTDVGFKVFYETEGGTEYVVGAFETAPPAMTG